MKIAIIGLGKTGSLIQSAAKARGHSTITIDSGKPEADFPTIQAAPLVECDCCIDFTHPDTILDTIQYVLSNNVPLVVGTTGWYDNLTTVKELVSQSNSAFLYATNFSIGVQLFSAVVRHAASLFNAFDEYDVAGFEMHHNQKADSPSGTARTIAEILVEQTEKKQTILYGSPDRQINATELHFPSLRCGHIPGLHEAIFDSEVDTVRIQHTARNRHGFARGAVRAAEWLQGKTGFFSINDLIEEALQEK